MNTEKEPRANSKAKILFPATLKRNKSARTGQNVIETIPLMYLGSTPHVEKKTVLFCSREVY